MNAIKNHSMLEDEKLSEEELFEKYGIERETSIGHIMTKLVEEGVYKVDEVLKLKWQLRNEKEKSNKFIYDLYKTLENTELLQNFGDIFFQAQTKEFFAYETGFRFIEGVYGVLKQKFLNGEITYDSWLKIMKEFKNDDEIEFYYDLIDNREYYIEQREDYLKIKSLLEKIPEGVNQSKLILEFLVKYGYKEDERIRGYYKYDDGKSYEEGGKNSTFGRIPKELQIDDMKRIFRGIEYILDISYNEAVELFNDYLDLKIKQGEFANGVKVLLNKKSK